MCCRGSQRGGLERGGDRSAGLRSGLEWAELRSWAASRVRTRPFRVLERTLGVVGELEPLSNPSFPSDRRKMVGLGLLWL